MQILMLYLLDPQCLQGENPQLSVYFNFYIPPLCMSSNDKHKNHNGRSNIGLLKA